MDARKLVKQAERDPWNRLNSIIEDADWVASFHKNYAPHLPIIPNLRCGAWYVPQSLAKGCYFKSTDGHNSQWDFSLKRYNLDLIYTITKRGGCIIVDSTRRGKSMSDALSKTIPIWCAVLNAASNKKYGTPGPSQLKIAGGDVVSPSEQEQIAARMQGWVDALLSSDLIIPQLDKPLVPLFATRQRKDLGVCAIGGKNELDYYPIVLLSASQMVPTPGLDPMQSPVLKSSLNLPPEIESLRRQARYIYVQGSGDDEEMWSLHVTPQIFWKADNLCKILEAGAGGATLDAILQDIASTSKIKNYNTETKDDVKVGDFGIFFGTREAQHAFTSSEKQKYAFIVQADAAETSNDDDMVTRDGKDTSSCRILQLNIAQGKKGLKEFLTSLPPVTATARLTLPGPILLCSQETKVGGDLVGGFAIAILAMCFDDAQTHIQDPPIMSKESVRRRLQWITTLLPEFTPPSRSHLLRLNEFLLSDRYKSDSIEKLTHKMTSLIPR